MTLLMRLLSVPNTKIRFLIVVTVVALSVPFTPARTDDMEPASRDTSEISRVPAANPALPKSDAVELARALDLARTGNYHEGSVRLYRLSHDPRFHEQAMQIKYILGLMLYEMKFYQASAYQ